MENESHFKQCLEEIKQRVLVSSVVGKRVKLKRVGREFIGLSPFTAEKTPSFTVNDEKKFWHCFSSGLHGDIFSFLQRMDNAPFKQVVEQLAAQAGVTLPLQMGVRDIREVERIRVLKNLMQVTVEFYQKGLHNTRLAQNYLRERGVTDESVTFFRLGFAPDAEDALKKHLLAQGFLFDDIREAGLIVQGEAHSLSYDRFRGRIIFPIFNEVGEPIALGGRIIAPHPKRPKYLNSPQTVLFHKGEVLYNLNAARGPALEKKEIVVVEGYMDVVALVQAGIRYAVASMGTAVGEGQLLQLWRLTPTPTLCFDGDKAGVQAAFRAVERVLPLLRPGYSLFFCLLPEGRDPFDVVQGGGAPAFQNIWSGRQPLVDIVWQYLLHQNSHLNTPEERAMLEARAQSLLETIADKTIRHHYRRAIFARIWHLFRPSGKKERREGRSSQSAVYESRLTDALRSSQLVQHSDKQDSFIPCMLLLAVIYHPSLLIEHGDRLLNLPFINPKLIALRQAILEAPGLDSNAIIAFLSEKGFKATLNQLMHNPLAKNERLIQPGADFEHASAWFAHVLEQWESQQAFAQNLEHVQAHLKEDDSGEASFHQLRLLHGRLKETK